MLKPIIFIPQLLVLLALVLVHGTSSTSKSDSSSTVFDFGTLSLTSLKLLGDAHLNNGTISLSLDLPVPNSGSGRVLYSKPVRFKQEPGKTPNFLTFSSFFTFSVKNLNPSSIGGGLAFVMSSDDQTIGDAGGFLGLLNNQDKEKISGISSFTTVTSSVSSSFVAVEFDTLMDVEFNDINGNHVGLDLNDLVSTQVGDLSSIDIDIKSGDLINAWIEYDGETKVFNISVSYSTLHPVDPLLSFHLDLDQYVNDFMFVGFSASTQGSTEIHTIDWWSFSSSFHGKSDSNSSPAPLSGPGAGVGAISSAAAPPPPPRTSFYVPIENSSNPSSTPPSLPPSDTESHESSSNCHNQLCKKGPGAVAGVVTASAFVFVIFAGVFIWVFSKKFKSVKKSEYLTSEIIRTPREFSYKDLKLATRTFSPVRVIGHGAFGTVYKGILPETGQLVAVKKCSHNGGQGKEEFLSELSIIGTLRHRNLLSLQGWCHEKGEILLVYDFMANGSLDKALFESRFVLQWVHRRKILIGVASALAYLHQECENQVIHRDVKTSNIMLDEGFNGKLGDFGLARQVEHDKSPVATVTAGTMGYLAPEYLLTGKATEKTDVFSFGAVILEVATGRRPIQKEANNNVVGGGKNGGGGGSSNLVDWVWSLHREERLVSAADLRLGTEFDIEEMRKILLVGLVCSHPDQHSRPTMRSVVQMLVGETQVPIVPKSKPSMGFSTDHLLMTLQDSVSDFNDDENEMMLNRISTSSDENSFDGILQV
ncbi:hypothetical protein C5167_000583 [Papaver somniferum]|uniref:non-specific serine/threonine protein kinase n=1 Tax=Papaver somniferum TaxID=3469 RepID=A0A4Y7KUJ5_PAPSO|nr:L-type lectin-domain containing receptor kinase VIII.1-like [Papaver somniferum]RZC76457.1 hypothetical protein C5167_000583 [Papaver somniferum]